MAEKWPWRLRPRTIRSMGLPKARIISSSKAYELILAVCESATDAHRVLADIKVNGVAVELPDHSTLSARSDGSFLLMEVNNE